MAGNIGWWLVTAGSYGGLERIGFQRFQSFGTLEMALNSGFALAVPKVPKKRVFFLILRAHAYVIKMETLELWNQLHVNADRQWF